MEINQERKILKQLFYFQWLTFPSMVFAQSFQLLRDVITQFRDLIVIAFPLTFALLTIFFVWGVSVFILNAGDSKKREEGKQRMIWGIVGLFVAISIFGIVALLNKVFGVPAG